MSAAAGNTGMPSVFWVTFPLDDTMQQINAHVFYELGRALQACFNSAYAPFRLWSDAPKKAKELLEYLLRGESAYVFDESRSAAEALLPLIDGLVQAHGTDPNGVQDASAVEAYNAAHFRFGAALQLELGRAPIFYVTPKGVYDTRRLIENARAVFEGYTDRLAEDALADTDQSGRCLAFNLPTAAGFHIARATEVVIRQYMEAVKCDPVKPSQRNWGAYIGALRKKNANARVVHHLDQLRELHRNPLLHPEQTLNFAEAVSLFSLCCSIIQAMVSEMSVLAGEEPVAPLPDPVVSSPAPGILMVDPSV